MDLEKGKWFLAKLETLMIQKTTHLTYTQLKEDFEKQFDDFELFWYSKPIDKLREKDLLLLL